MNIEIRAKKVTSITGHYGFTGDAIVELDLTVENALEAVQSILGELTGPQIVAFLRARFPNEVDVIEAEARA